MPSVRGSESAGRESYQHLGGLQLSRLDKLALDPVLTVLGWGRESPSA